MNYKETVNRGIVIGLLSFLVLFTLGWFAVPSPEVASNEYWVKWLFIYSIPIFFGVLAIVLKRYNSEELIKGCMSSNEGLAVDRAFLQNTIEQTVIALPLVASFGVMAPASMLKLVPIHAVTFIVGRLVFWCGYKKSYHWRIPGFIITNYANLALLVCCIWLLVIA